jgi:hypothetical protein
MQLRKPSYLQKTFDLHSTLISARTLLSGYSVRVVLLVPFLTG